jgi:hypothetical protein
LKRGLTGGPHLSAGGREGEGRWAGGCLRGPKEESEPREKGKKGKNEVGRGPDREGVWGLVWDFWVFFFFFFSNPFRQLLKTFLNQTLLHLFHNFFINYFKDF